MQKRSFLEKTTPFLRKLIKQSKAIQKQYCFDPKELISEGSISYFDEGKEACGCLGLERLYNDRVILLIQRDCPAFCRFCFRKNRIQNAEQSMTKEQMNLAVKKIAGMKKISRVLITGGEPFLRVDNLFYLLDKLSSLKNIYEIRIGTRALLTMPQIFTKKLCQKLASYNRCDYENPLQSRSLILNVHFNHKDEFAAPVMQAIERLNAAGIIMRNQAVLLKGVNDEVAAIRDLQAVCIRNNIIPYYLSHCDPVIGNDHFRTSVAKGAEIMKELSRESSSALFDYIIDMPVGKVHVRGDFVFQYVYKKGKRYLQIKTPYKAKDFFANTQKKQLPELHSIAKDGTIEGLYLDGNDDR